MKEHCQHKSVLRDKERGDYYCTWCLSRWTWDSEGNLVQPQETDAGDSAERA
jgi:hypothetical protein